MSEKNVNINSFGIEKYEGSFEQDDLGVTQIPTDSIRAIKNTTDLALFTFLASCPKDWRLNAKHLANHFECDKEKIYKSIDSLIEKGFLSRTVIREKGKFAKFHYKLHLRVIHRDDLPFPEKPDTVLPDTENPDAYKTNNVKNIECTKEDIDRARENVDNSLQLHFDAQKESDESFEYFFSLYPVKKAKLRAKSVWFSQKCYEKKHEIIYKLSEQIEKDRQFLTGFAPNPERYLLEERWNDEIQTKQKKQSNAYDSRSRQQRSSDNIISSDWADVIMKENETDMHSIDHEKLIHENK